MSRVPPLVIFPAGLARASDEASLMTIHLRADRAVFRFSGPDAHRLLNDVVTGEIPSTGNGDGEPAAAWALLSPQGKILAEGLAGHAEDALWLDVHQSVADDFFKRMKLYRLRAQVVMDDLRETHRVGFAQAVQPTGIRHTDRLGPIGLGWRAIAPVEATGDWVQDDAFYQRQRIDTGIVHQGNDFPANEAFAHDIGMDILDGIDFAKGCYVGQEVVSRMKHRGTARRRPVIISGIDAPAGTPVMAGDREAGTIGQVVDGRAVAIVRLDRITDPAAVTVGGKPVQIGLPVWANYRLGDSVAEDE
jgi:folate-binding protein YgfZ